MAEILHARVTSMANYSCKKFSPTLYPLAIVHPLRTTDNRQTTSQQPRQQLDRYLSMVG